MDQNWWVQSDWEMANEPPQNSSSMFVLLLTADCSVGHHRIPSPKPSPLDSSRVPCSFAPLPPPPCPPVPLCGNFGGAHGRKSFRARMFAPRRQKSRACSPERDRVSLRQIEIDLSNLINLSFPVGSTDQLHKIHRILGKHINVRVKQGRRPPI